MIDRSYTAIIATQIAFFGNKSLAPTVSRISSEGPCLDPSLGLLLLQSTACLKQHTGRWVVQKFVKECVCAVPWDRIGSYSGCALLSITLSIPRVIPVTD